MKNPSKKIFTLGVVGLIGFILLTGCEKQEETEDDKESVGRENLLEDVEAKKVEETVDLPDSFIKANASFSVDLFEKLAQEENALYSPLPVYHSLALIANGADKESQDEIIKSFDLDNRSVEEMNQNYNQLMEEFENSSSASDLTLSHSIWYDDSFEANGDYLRTNKSYYDTDSFKIDFKDAEAPDLMNDWVSDQSNGKIEEMVDEIDPAAVMYLFSTIYFDGQWETPFKASDSYEDEFIGENETVAIEKMSRQFEMEHLTTEEEEGVILPYEDSDYSFLALMPSEDVTVRDYLAELNSEKVMRLWEQVNKEEIDLHLPKFELTYEKLLNEPLEELGIVRIFDPSMNSLEKMGEANGNLFVNKIFQKNCFAVDEEGTEAASAVGSEIATTSLPMQAKVIDFNRPFLYGIVHEETNLPIFLGIMDQPE